MSKGGNSMEKISLQLDSLALLLFCCHLKEYREVPVTTDEWLDIEKKIHYYGLKGPTSLLSMTCDEMIEILQIDEFCAYKMTERIKTMATFISALNILETKGIKIITKYDKEYPRDLLKYNKKRAPLYLFYCGDIAIIKRGISIAGLSEVRKKENAYTKRLVDKIIEEDAIYISNNTKGVDTVALHYALHHGGKAVCFVCEQLEEKNKEYRRYLKNKQLVMVSAVAPNMKFDVTNAIDRNGYVCGLSVYQIIVASNINNGATWFTALQNMHHHWTIPFVVENDCIGNVRLLDMGAVPMRIKDILSEYSFDMIYDRNKKMIENENVDIDQMSIFEFLGENNESGL